MTANAVSVLALALAVSVAVTLAQAFFGKRDDADRRSWNSTQFAVVFVVVGLALYLSSGDGARRLRNPDIDLGEPDF
jgi:NADH:ubiquinone oxidoreductase subunit 6 (subunit J)